MGKELYLNPHSGHIVLRQIVNVSSEGNARRKKGDEAEGLLHQELAHGLADL